MQYVIGNENGKPTYSLMNDGQELFKSDKVALFYTYNPQDVPIKGTLIKHGIPELVKKLYNEYVEAEFLLDELKYVEFDQVDVEELNKVLSITGYIGNFHEKFIMNK